MTVQELMKINTKKKLTFRNEFMKTPLNTLVKSYSSLFPSVLVLFCCPENIMQIIYKQLPIITFSFCFVDCVSQFQIAIWMELFVSNWKSFDKP